MALRAKHLFFIVIVTQITLLILFAASRDRFRWFKLDAPIQNVSNHNSQLNISQQDGNLIALATASIPTVVLSNSNGTHGQSPGIEDRARAETDVERQQTESGNAAEGSSVPASSDVRTEIDGSATSSGLSTNVKPEPAVFQQINDTKAWVYSAFFDHMAAQSGRPMVRIFGLAVREYLQKVTCTFTTDAGNLTITSFLLELPDSHGVKYPPTHLECFLPKNTRPTHVSISFQTNQTLINRLPVLYPGPRIRNFTVCYSVLHSGYNKITQIVESIEMNRILGADHFMIYNYSISPEVDQILRRYQEDGLVTVLPWPIPTLNTWYFAQVMALTDCVYRNRNVSRFVVVADMDELIVPRSSHSWMELLHSAVRQETDVSRFVATTNQSKTGGTLTGCFLFRSSHFPMDWIPKWDSLPAQFTFTDEEKRNVIKYNMLALTQIVRTETIAPPRIRSKYIARPELVYHAGIHVVQKFIHFMRCFNVDASLGLVHHYRKYNMRKGLVNDTSVLKFKQNLYTRVMEQIKQFPNIFT